MRDKRTHRNYARNSLNLTFLLRYTGSACSEVTNFIGKRAIYRSPRSHTISAPATCAPKPVYTGDETRAFRFTPILNSDSRIPSSPRTMTARFTHLDLRYRTLSPAEINVADLYDRSIPSLRIDRPPIAIGLKSSNEPFDFTFQGPGISITSSHK